MQSIDDLIQFLVRLGNLYLDPPPKEVLSLVTESLLDQTYPDVKLFNKQKIYDNIVLVSGGVDSTLAYWLAQSAFPNESLMAIHINFGQTYCDRERMALKELGISFGCFDYKIGISQDAWSYYIPLRNLIAAMVGVLVGGNGSRIWLGYVEDDINSSGGDKSAHFIKLLRDYLSHYECSLALLDIFTKSDWIQWAKYNEKLPVLLNTFSCLENPDYHCGKCQSCLKRYLSFSAAGVSDEMILHNYLSNPIQDNEVKRKYLLRILTDDSAYQIRKRAYINYARVLFDKTTEKDIKTL